MGEGAGHSPAPSLPAGSSSSSVPEPEQAGCGPQSNLSSSQGGLRAAETLLRPQASAAAARPDQRLLIQHKQDVDAPPPLDFACLSAVFLSGTLLSVPEKM